MSFRGVSRVYAMARPRSDAERELVNRYFAQNDRGATASARAATLARAVAKAARESAEYGDIVLGPLRKLAIHEGDLVMALAELHLPAFLDRRAELYLARQCSEIGSEAHKREGEKIASEMASRLAEKYRRWVK